MAVVGRYSIVRYAENYVREEWTNVGILLASDSMEKIEIRFLDRLTGRNFSSDQKDFLRPFKRRFSQEGIEANPGETPEETLESLVHDWQNALQLTPPKACKIEDIEETLDYLYRTFVAVPKQERDEATFGRRPLLRSVKQRLTSQGLMDHIERNPRIEGHIGRYKLDFQVRESPTFVHALPLPTERESEFVDVVAAWETKVPDILGTIEDATVDLVVQPESTEGEYGERARHGQELLNDVGASVVRHDDLDPMIEDIERSIST